MIITAFLLGPHERCPATNPGQHEAQHGGDEGAA
jgi:hypothetical protein